MAQSEVIVGGRVLAWSETAFSHVVAPFTPIRLTLSVDRVFTGTADAEVEFIDNASLDRLTYAGEVDWGGASGACGAFDADPAGAYTVLGLWRDETGVLRSNRLLVFYLGPEPGGPEFDAALERIAEFERLAPPSTGSAGMLGKETREPSELYVVASIMTAVLALCVAVAVANRARGAGELRPKDEAGPTSR